MNRIIYGFHAETARIRREAERRLERVEQNLLRLTDVLAEVQKSLRSIKYQAGKARSYQQYTAELKDLRALHSLAEYW